MSADDTTGVALKPPLSILDTAKALVEGQRQNDYGPPAECLKRMAKAISVALAAILKRDPTAHEAAVVMIAVKLARLGATPTHRDTWVDLAGYASLIDHLEGTT